MIGELQKETKRLRNKERAEHSQKFFKTGKGEYGEGDIFYGLTNPICHQLVNKYKNLNLKETENLLYSKIHEERLIALLILVKQFTRPHLNSDEVKKEIFNLYLKNTRYINNWDLVDLSAHKIVGSYLYLQGQTLKNKSAKGLTLIALAKSDNLWERRIAIISTFAFLGKDSARETLEIAKILVNDRHDLIHKAVGWALREVGKRCGEKIERDFLDKFAKVMPRTMLRYAIERFDQTTRYEYLQVKQKSTSSN